MIFHTMIQDKVQQNERNEVINSIGKLRASLDAKLPERDKFHKWYTQVKTLPEFFDIAKKTINK